MNKADINKLLDIKSLNLSPQYLIIQGPEKERIKAVSIEVMVCYFLVLCAMSTLVLIQNDFTVTLSGIVSVLLVSAVFTGLLITSLGQLLHWLHNEYSAYLTYPSMRIREKKYKDSCDLICKDVEEYIRDIEGETGFLWKFAGCIPHMNNTLNDEQLEDLISASSRDRESINVSHYYSFISDLKHYYKRAPVRDSFKDAVHRAGPCIKPEFV